MVSSSNTMDEMEKPEESRFICQTCKASFDDKQTMINHWKTEYAKGNRHYFCEKCMMMFRTEGAAEMHYKQFHQIDQKMGCPGCKATFVRMSGFVDHIEKNRCNTISNARFHEEREKALRFARQLQMVPGQHENKVVTFTAWSGSNKGPAHYTQYLSTTEDETAGDTLSSLRPLVDSSHKPDPVAFQMMSLGQKGDLLTGPGSDHPEQSSEAGDMRVLFPSYTGPATTPAVAPARPAPAQAQGWREPEKRPVYDRHDPRNPNWDPKQYYNQYTRKYGCPRERCIKSFPTSNGLRNHILTHPTTGFQVQCPVCSKWFDTNAALAQHAESEGSKCKIRKSEDYARFMGQFTAGMVDTKLGSAGMTVYTVSAQAKKTFGNKKDGEEDKGVDGWGKEKTEEKAEKKNDALEGQW
ncbi:uncharacterized protein QC763_202410 [Podospora pseudopauciseta]|uniref:C2H2-type domain-containing protein n=1 Tax=Podospora pseudopauciseta TaxID=2093780 RepID=A0ABR0HN82_9PEZI|nr:hypothetical protein QC763_202410 [Podospora pseudopauciseta]